MQSVREAGVDWIKLHIVELWPGEQQPVEIAEALAAIAAERGLPIEAVIEWLHVEHDAGAELSSIEFTRRVDGRIH